ncbi:MAG: hypothetical protein AAGD25_04905 [Cyanobacteria bacterium P01_F01_bin.150]
MDTETLFKTVDHGNRALGIINSLSLNKIHSISLYYSGIGHHRAQHAQVLLLAACNQAIAEGNTDEMLDCFEIPTQMAATCPKDQC